MALWDGLNGIDYGIVVLVGFYTDASLGFGMD